MASKYLLDILSAIEVITSPSSFRSLDTRKIDSHINELKNHSWFIEIYQDEKYRRLFNVNFRIRHYLESRFRVKRLINKPNAQEKFIRLLEKQITK